MRNPLYDDLCQVLGGYTISFHTPGHKYKAMQDLALMRIDTTEIDGTDHLHHSKSILKAAQERAATAYGAKEAFFLVNGTTCGIQAMIKAAVPKGKKLVTQRDAHKSVFNTCALFDIPVEIIEPYYDRPYGITKGIRLKSLEKLIAEGDDIGAVLVTSPSYYGLTLDIKHIAALCHAQGIPLLVDEAHGAHFAFSDVLPATALEQGADVVCQSTHKTLPAMTQASLLLVGSDRVPLDQLRLNLEMLQSSSPSYVLMNSIDYAIYFSEQHGPRLIKHIEGKLHTIRRSLRRKIGLVDLQTHFKKYRPDPLRWIIASEPFKMSGYALEEKLRKHYGIQMELSSENFVLAIVSMLNSPAELVALEEALIKIAFEADHNRIKPARPIALREKYRPVISLAEALGALGESVALDDAEGRILKSAIIPYPPGVPMVLPGERLTKALIERIKNIAHKQEVNGVEDGQIIVLMP